MPTEVRVDKKKLFFGLEIVAPWPHVLPKARIVEPGMRHLTLAFLGDVFYAPIEKLLPDFPKPSFPIGPSAQFDRCLILPEKRPRVVCWHVAPFGEKDVIGVYRDQVYSFLVEQGYALDQRPFLPHVTLGRSPFVEAEWEKAFTRLPCYSRALHLYESLGSLKYQPLWSHLFHSPFEELEHVADLAFSVYGRDLIEIDRHAKLALAFESPELLSFFNLRNQPSSLEEVMIDLNTSVTAGDRAIGMPFKAVSFHGNLEPVEEGLFKWEMIVDV